MNRRRIKEFGDHEQKIIHYREFTRKRTQSLGLCKLHTSASTNFFLICPNSSLLTFSTKTEMSEI